MKEAALIVRTYKLVKRLNVIRVISIGLIVAILTGLVLLNIFPIDLEAEGVKDILPIVLWVVVPIFAISVIFLIVSSIYIDKLLKKVNKK